MSLDPQKQREFALQVVQRLRDEGHIAYWAGGCVRDQLLGLLPKDYDVATDAVPQRVREIFGHRRTHAIGAAFGVITVLGPRGAGHVEVTTFRRDESYRDGRRPESVAFTSAEEDASRRDFTINGLFFDPIDARVIDYVGGQQDLQMGVVRAIGDPHARITEDKLRMLRGVRFAATFDFRLDSPTLDAIRQMAAEITVVSPERIAQEMRLLLTIARRVRGVELLFETGLLDVLLPEVVAMRGIPQNKQRQPDGDLWDHTLLVLSELRGGSFELSLAALLHDVGKPRTMSEAGGRLSFHEHETVGAHIAGKITERWKLSNRERERVVWLVKHHMYLAHARQMRWAKLQRTLTAPGIEELLDLHEADARASSHDVTDIEYCRELLQLPPDALDPPALLTGHDLIRHGLAPGKEFHVLLEKVRDAQLEKRVRSKRDALTLVDELLARGLAERDDEDGNSLPVDKPSQAT